MAVMAAALQALHASVANLRADARGVSFPPDDSLTPASRFRANADAEMRKRFSTHYLNATKDMKLKPWYHK